MRQIYDFEREIPPALNEKMLREELRRRGRRREVALLAMASVLLQLTLLMAGVWLLASSALAMQPSPFPAAGRSRLFTRRRRRKGKEV